MPRDITPLRNALDETTPGNQNDVYTLLAAWDRSVEAVVERSSRGRFQEVMTQYLDEVIELVDTAATNEGIDWAFLQECVEAYPPGDSDHNCSSVLTNVVARCVIRTRINRSVDEIPAWTLDYLDAITKEGDGVWGWEAAEAYGWGVGHPNVAVLDDTLERAESGDDLMAAGILEHVAFADPDAAITLLEQLLRSPEIVEDFMFLGGMESVFQQDFPNAPEYWDADAELEYEVAFTDDQLDRLLAVLGETVDPDRLRHFDEQSAFDLQRTAEEYGSESSG